MSASKPWRPLTLVERIAANPNPRADEERRAAERKVKLDAALDSARNVFAVLGVGCVLAQLSVMRWFFLIPGAVLLASVWYADYRRHF